MYPPKASNQSRVIPMQHEPSVSILLFIAALGWNPQAASLSVKLEVRSASGRGLPGTSELLEDPHQRLRRWASESPSACRVWVLPPALCPVRMWMSESGTHVSALPLEKEREPVESDDACVRACVCVCVWADEILVICSEIFRLHPNDPALPHTVILRMGTCCLFKYDALLWLLLLWFSLICRSTCCIWTPSPRDSSSWLWGTRAPESHTEEFAFWARLLSVIQRHLLSTCYVPGTEKCMTAQVLPRGFCIVPWLTAGPKRTQPKV